MMDTIQTDENALYIELDDRQQGAVSPRLFGTNIEHTRACVYKGLSAQLLRNLIHFCSRGGMDMEGFGDAVSRARRGGDGLAPDERDGHGLVAGCGESASDPVLGVLWTGLGVTELSMSAGYIPPIRKVLQAVSADDARALAERVLGYGSSRTAAEIYAECRALVLSKVPEFEEMQSFFTAG